MIQTREEILIKAKDKILNSDNENTLEDAVTNVPEGFDDWIWREEKFPYPALQFRRVKSFYPHDVFCFFKKDEYRDSVLSGKHRQTFLNYCKMVVYHLSLKLGDTLVLEVNRAEATMRFFAGTYYAFFSSCWVLLAALLVQVGVPTIEGIQQTFSGLGVLEIIEHYRVINIFLTFVLGLAVFIMQQMILRRYRTLRIREVDLVYEAFYLIHQQDEKHDERAG